MSDDNSKFEELKARVKDFPTEPGVYLMKDREGTIIYVGKAKVLTNRLRSYFLPNKDIKTTLLVRRIHTIETIITKTEYEALLLENNLIKKHKPRFNLALKDDRSYPMIRITKDDFPRIFKTRRIIEDGSEYFGPYPNVRHLDLYLEIAEKLYPLRKCQGPLKQRQAACLYYHIGKCLGPCIGKTTKEEYRGQVQKVRNLLQGKTVGLQKDLTSQMKQASAELKFEQAAEIRDSLKALVELEEGQKVMDFNPEQRDYIALAAEGNHATFVILQMRGGKLLGRDLFHTEIYEDEEEAFQQFLLQYYTTHPLPQDSVYISKVIDTEPVLQAFAAEGKPGLDIHFPEGGRHYSILRMAVENATSDLRSRLETGGNQLALVELKRVLNLDKLPHRIEGFDIAQLDGNFPVASLISFWNGKPDRKNYRKMHIKSLKGAIDDYQSIKEAVTRRYSRLQMEEKELPDLILIDGGKGQVNAAFSVLTALGLSVPVIGLAKKHEEIYFPNVSDPVILPHGSPALRVLQAVRDETHRFATGFNQLLRHKKLGLGLLEGIEGIGEKRSQKLLVEFGSLDKLEAADVYEIAQRGGLPLALAETVKTYLADRKVREKTVTDLKRSRRS